MRTIGYLRVSTQEQRPDRQIDGLRGLCDEFYIEQASAVSPKRPIFEDVLGALKPGDALVIWDLDRAFRSVVDAITHAEKLRERGVTLRIVNLQVDTATPSGMLVYTVMSAFAEFERRVLSQRTKEGLAAARRRGKRLGRPPAMSAAQINAARDRLSAGETATTVAETYGIAPWSLRRSIRRADCDEGAHRSD